MSTTVTTQRFKRHLRTLTALVALCAALQSSFATATEPQTDSAVMHCGWFHNPTPGNAWLIDREGQWIIATQGGHQAEGDWPKFRPKDWVTASRSYGYGCACMEVVADATSHEVQRIVRAKSRPLSACKNDPAIAGRAPKD